VGGEIFKIVAGIRPGETEFDLDTQLHLHVVQEVNVVEVNLETHIGLGRRAEDFAVGLEELVKEMLRQLLPRPPTMPMMEGGKD
jgi:hypothetical protein